jgi:hypothetical protein
MVDLLLGHPDAPSRIGGTLARARQKSINGTESLDSGLPPWRTGKVRRQDWTSRLERNNPPRAGANRAPRLTEGFKQGFGLFCTGGECWEGALSSSWPHNLPKPVQIPFRSYLHEQTVLY